MVELSYGADLGLAKKESKAGQKSQSNISQNTQKTLFLTKQEDQTFRAGNRRDSQL